MHTSNNNASFNGVRRAPEMARVTDVRPCGGSRKRIILFLAPLLALWGMAAAQGNVDTKPIPAGMTRTQCDLMEAQSEGQNESTVRLFHELRQRSLSPSREASPKRQLARLVASS